MSKIKNPNAAVLIWTYKDRLTHEPSNPNNVHSVHETVLNTLSLVSIQTNKSKSQPNGTFTFTLAPYKNWVSFIAPGSWCAILMTNNDLPKINRDNYTAKPTELKFFGRINSVRGSVHVNPDGTRQTMYICEGEDWGSIFNTVLYVDPAARQPQDSPVGVATSMIYGDLLKSATSGQTSLPTTTTNVKALLNLWGDESNFLTNLSGAFKLAGGGGGMIISPEVVFKIPKQVKQFLGASSDSLCALVQEGLRVGKLVDLDTYEDSEESVGIIDPSSVFGSHPIWGVMKDNSNEIINEMFCDLRFENGKPKLALYKRVRPFITLDVSPLERGTISIPLVTPNASAILNGLNALSTEKTIAAISSKFEYVRRVMIPKDEIISFDAGTNWRDKLNFVEILPDESQFTYNGKTFRIDTASKGYAQHADRNAFGREGLKAAKFTTRFYPIDKNGNPNFYDPGAWSKVVAQWYFNNHNFLNGTIEFIGQNEFISVGDNIMVDASIFGPKPNMSSKQLKNGGAYFLLHVENLSHNFSVNQDGARHWTTTIAFTRGVLCNEKGTPLDITAIDRDSTKLSAQNELNNYNSVSTSSDADPDVQTILGK